MTNKELLQIAMRQSAEDIGCRPEDFLSDINKIVPFILGQNSKSYYELPIEGNLISYGNNVVATATEELTEEIAEYINRFEFYHCFETPNMYWLNKIIEPKGYTVCLMAEYYLPDLGRLTELPCEYKLRILGPADFTELYEPQWSNALCSDRKQLDVLGVGAYDGEELVGLCGCSSDAKEMWQIGVDVLPGYRRKGIASAITSRLALEILNRNKVPFYCSAWSNIRSVRNAIKSGFLPAWAEMTIKPTTKADEMNENHKQNKTEGESK